MKLLHFLRTSGFLANSLVAATALIAGCNYGFSGGGGFPSDVRTIYIEPFENQTVQVELDQQLFRKLTDRLPRALGGRPGSETNADAVVRGRILRYEDVAQSYRATTGQQQQSGVDVLTHQVQITIAVEIIDRKRNVVLWDSNSVVGRGEYRINDQRDTDAREQALNHILQLIIDGAQSQW
ncbi:MAG TPA: LPS assembly lipoprotein LptE [Longimicrobiales bacterium]